MKASRYWALGLACVLAVLAGACGGGEDQAGAAAEAEMTALQEQKAALDGKRGEIAALKEQIATAGEMGDEAAEGAEGEEVEAGPSVEELQAQLEQLEGEEEAMSESYMTAIVTVLNSANMIEGEAIPESIQQVIRMKSAEDVMIAREYIWEGGDYRRAIEILDTALMLDPENADLQAARDQANVDQYMTEERFAQVAKGMTPDEVRARIGTVNRHNLREYPDRNVTAWFYRREDKGAAGVWFEEKDGQMIVYRFDFNAIEAPTEDGEPAAEPDPE
jgi:hypothetical protein